MKKFTMDAQDPFDGFGNAIADAVYPNFFQTISSGDVNAPVPLPPKPALSSETVMAEAAQSGAVTVTAVTSGGITINLLFDAAAMAAPASFRAGIQQAVSLLTAAISDKITVNIQIDYSGTGGGASAGPDDGQFLSYSSVRADLVNNKTPGDTTFNALPAGSSIQGQSSVVLWNAQLKLYGLLGANDTTTDDGSATFATDINPNLLVGVALHELTHALARVPYGPQPDVFDLFRFTSAGTHLFSGSDTAPAAYFSIDGGTTKLADYGQTSDPSDFLNSGVQGSHDPFNEFYGGATLQTLTAIDLKQLDALGFHTMAPAQQSIVVTATASQAVQGGAAVTLLTGPPTITDSASTTLSSAAVRIANAGGSAVAGDKLYVNGVQSGTVATGVTASWNASTDTLTLTGTASLAVYDTLLNQVSYQDTGTDLSTGSHPARTVTWTVNDGAATVGATSQIAIERAPAATASNVVLNGFTPVAASSLFTASDSDADTIATYAFKDTANGHFVLNGATQANNQEIDVTAAQLSQLTYQSTGGVDTLQVRVSDGILWSAWQSFTATGPVNTVIESFGSTSLNQVGNLYFLYDSSGAGPSLKFQGANNTVGQWAPWAPIGGEKTASGYEVAWKAAGADQFTVWNTDNNGNDTTNTIGTVSGSSTALESLEISFHQDLNGDGVIGIPATTVIEALGSTQLTQVGNLYYLYDSGGVGPSLKYQGTDSTVGQWGPWAPIAAEKTASGYEVAWKAAGADQYTVWNTDNNGNDTTNTIGTVSGSSAALKSLEASFHQDLNGDGIIVLETQGSTQLAQVGNLYFLYDSGGAGPSLKFQNADIAVGQWAPWAPIGGEKTASGYEVAWKAAGADQFTVWNTDNNGNDTTNTVGTVSGSSTALESLETSFHQDLNGDGVIGIPSGQAGVASSAPNQASPTAAAMIANNDTFVFGAAVVGVTAEPAQHQEYSSPIGDQLAALFRDAQSDPSQLVVPTMDSGHDAVASHNLDSIGRTNAQIADLHASVFIH